MCVLVHQQLEFSDQSVQCEGRGDEHSQDGDHSHGDHETSLKQKQRTWNPWINFPMDTRCRNNNVIITSKRRRDVVLT